MAAKIDTQEAPWKPGLFDFTDALGKNKRDLLAEDPSWEKEYSAFMVNAAFSQHLDSILYANEMNRLGHLPKRLQHDFYFHALPRMNRFGKWAKKAPVSKDLPAVAAHLGCSSRQALGVLHLLTETDLQVIRDGYQTGGR